MIAGLSALVALAGYQQIRAAQEGAPQAKKPAAKMVPYFEWDETFPKLPLKNNWVLGTVVGVGIDAQDHVWIAHRAETLNPNELNGESGRGECCVRGPHVMEFDYAGNLLQAWGGASKNGEYDWPTAGTPSPDPTVGGGPNGMHSVFVDSKDNVWLTGTGASDGQMLKFSRTGKFLLQIGHVGRTKPDSNDTENLNKATGVAEYAPTNEMFVSDGYGNRRVIVFDATTGKYKRHWGAFGNKPVDGGRYVYDPNTPNQQFNTPHGIGVSKDGMVYVADRNNSRIQSFKVDGTFVAEKYIEPHAMSGTAFGVAVSPGTQDYLYVPDGRNEKVWILERKTLDIIGSFGCPGHAGGCMTTPHSIATDSKGNVYVGETWEGKRVQRYLYKGLRPRS